MMMKILMLGAAALILQAVPAFAAEDSAYKSGKGGLFAKHDLNSDGVVTEDEYVSHARGKFSEMDANKDGKLTQEEGKAARESMRAKWKERREEMKEKQDAKEDAQ